MFEARGGGIDFPFAGIAIHAESQATIHLPNRIFACTETEQQYRCQTEVQDRLLVVVLEKRPGNLPGNCQAQYEGQSVGCRGTSIDYAPWTSESFEITPSGLSPQQLRAIRRKYWGVNTLLALGESGLFQISLLLSLSACGLGIYSVAGLLRRWASNIIKPLVAVGSGFGTGFIVGWVLLFALLESGFVD
ncbi:MAG: hypothetical protein AAGF01_02870 [Cyanobacteria bacterium P01_G01_bin.38]